jgi:hypothetical protein
LLKDAEPEAAAAASQQEDKENTPQTEAKGEEAGDDATNLDQVELDLMTQKKKKKKGAVLFDDEKNEVIEVKYLTRSILYVVFTSIYIIFLIEVI